MAVSLGGEVEGEGGSRRRAGKTEKKGSIREFYHAEIVSQNKVSCKRKAVTL